MVRVWSDGESVESLFHYQYIPAAKNSTVLSAILRARSIDRSRPI
jgi:hypothetical protein